MCSQTQQLTAASNTDGSTPYSPHHLSPPTKPCPIPFPHLQIQTHRNFTQRLCWRSSRVNCQAHDLPWDSGPNQTMATSTSACAGSPRDNPGLEIIHPLDNCSAEDPEMEMQPDTINLLGPQQLNNPQTTQLHPTHALAIDWVRKANSTHPIDSCKVHGSRYVAIQTW